MLVRFRSVSLQHSAAQHRYFYLLMNSQILEHSLPVPDCFRTLALPDSRLCGWFRSGLHWCWKGTVTWWRYTFNPFAIAVSLSKPYVTYRFYYPVPFNLEGIGHVSGWPKLPCTEQLYLNTELHCCGYWLIGW